MWTYRLYSQQNTTFQKTIVGKSERIDQKNPQKRALQIRGTNRVDTNRTRENKTRHSTRKINKFQTAKFKINRQRHRHKNTDNEFRLW